MNTRKVLLATVAGVGLFVAGYTAAQAPPEQDVDAQRHPYLAAAQNLIAQSYQKLTMAQQGNDWDMNGHAAKAEEYLNKAAHEIKEAALTANRH